MNNSKKAGQTGTPEQRAKRVRALVRTTTRNRVIDFVRGQHELLFQDVFGPDNDAAQIVEAGGQTPPESVAGKEEPLWTQERADALRDWIGRLKPRRRAIVLLKYYAGLKAAQVAAVLNICADVWPGEGLSGETSAQSVYNELEKARNKLRQLAREWERAYGRPNSE